MPYYSELGIYTSPTSTYTGGYIPGPYANHSSLLASNFSRPPSSLIKPRQFRGYKPHLATISESQSPLRRINSPKLILHTSPKVTVPRPIKINTSDIDVSLNKYRKYERQKPITDEKHERKSPPIQIESPRSSLEQKEAKPNTNIRRERPTVRIQTIHTDIVNKEIRKWRDNFQPEELYSNEFEEKKQRKTPGELLKEKFLIRSRENIFKPPEKKVKKGSKKHNNNNIEKTPSFHDICKAIATDDINKELNPGQPTAVQKRQSRRLSTEDLIKELKRNSADLSKDIEALAKMTDTKPEVFESRNSVRKKKKLTKKKSNEKLIITPPPTPEADINKSGLQRRLTHKKIKRTLTDSSVESEYDADTEKAYQEAIRDISIVEIEKIKPKSKPIIIATVDIEEKPTLKAIIDEVEIIESPKTKKPNKFKFNVIVEEVAEAKKKIGIEKSKEQNGVVHLPKLKEPIVTKVLKSSQNAQQGQIIQQISKPKTVKKLEEKPKVLDKILEENSKPGQVSVEEKQSVQSIIKDNDAINPDAGKDKLNKNEDNKINKSLAIETNQFDTNKVDETVTHQHIVLNKQKNNTALKDVTQNKIDSREELIKNNQENVEQKPLASIIINQKVTTLTKQTDIHKNNETVSLTTNDSNQIQTEKLNVTEIKAELNESKNNSTLNIASTKQLEEQKDLDKTKNDKLVKTQPSNIETGLNNIKETQKVETKDKSIIKSKSEKISLKKSKEIKKTNSLDKITNKKLSEQKILAIANKENVEKDEENFWAQIGPRESVFIPKKVPKSSEIEKDLSSDCSSVQEVVKNENKLEIEQSEIEKPEKHLISKRSLIQKATKDDPDLTVFNPPTPPPPPESEPEEPKSFVPLQSNRLSQFMHPFKKPEQLDASTLDLYATPKWIRKRHYPRPRHQKMTLPPPPAESSEDTESEEEEEETSSDDDEDDEYDVNVVYGSKVGASTSSNDSGFDSGVPGSRNKGSTESRDPPAPNPAYNPAFALDSNDSLDEYTQSSTYAGFQKSGRITPPATTIPRFRKYSIDDFNFLKVLGKGSFGKVLLAELKNTEYYYAIKCLKKDVVLEDDDVECTLIERKVLALATRHPYLCHLLCTFQTESHLFFVMEYLNGGDLMFHIQQHGRFDEPRARFYAAEIVSGLKFLHNKGIVYRDLKLDNILLDFDGHVRIADFGMCKLQIFLDRMADTFCGTPDYMAPEIIKGQHYNQCVDWWSFGVLLYEMLLGQSPFSGCDEDELFWSICNEKPVIPRFLSVEATAILLLFLEKDASKRLGNRFCPSGDIQDQPFFKPIQWDRLEARTLESPFKPDLQHPLDTKYFDKTFTIEKAKLTPIEQNILQSMDQTQFQGFSYTNPNATDK